MINLTFNELLICIFVCCLAAMFFYDAFYFILRIINDFFNNIGLIKGEIKTFGETFNNEEIRKAHLLEIHNCRKCNRFENKNDT